MRLTRRGKVVVATAWLTCLVGVAAGCTDMGEAYERSTPTATPVQEEPSPTLVREWCEEDEACWIGSPEDDRRGRELRQAMVDAGWKGVGNDCLALVTRTRTWERCFDGGDAIVSTRQW